MCPGQYTAVRLCMYTVYIIQQFIQVYRYASGQEARATHTLQHWDRIRLNWKWPPPVQTGGSQKIGGIPDFWKSGYIYAPFSAWFCWFLKWILKWNVCDLNSSRVTASSRSVSIAPSSSLRFFSHVKREKWSMLEPGVSWWFGFCGPIRSETESSGCIASFSVAFRSKKSCLINGFVYSPPWFISRALIHWVNLYLYVDIRRVGFLVLFLCCGWLALCACCWKCGNHLDRMSSPNADEPHRTSKDASPAVMSKTAIELKTAEDLKRKSSIHSFVFFLHFCLMITYGLITFDYSSDQFCFLRGPPTIELKFFRGMQCCTISFSRIIPHIRHKSELTHHFIIAVWCD